MAITSADTANADLGQTSELIINADDWGRNTETTNRILECVLHGTVSSASAMVFMEDSERAAALARERKVDVGLHLNFTTSYSMSHVMGNLATHQERVCRFLLRNRLAQVVYHPGLTNSFKYLVEVQLEEFRKLYGEEARRIDGHHHMHLCANVILDKLLPRGTNVRRSFSLQPGEKSGINRLYRRVLDQKLALRHRLTDLFFSLAPLKPAERLQRIFRAAHSSVVELETHPINVEEYRFLMGSDIYLRIDKLSIASCFYPALEANTNEAIHESHRSTL